MRDPGEDNDDYYHQAHLPVREQKEAVGHAVRAVYLYTGMAIIAKYTNDESLKSACERLWDSMTNEKMYVTGGIGGTPEGEAFSYPFHLPNDRMYKFLLCESDGGLSGGNPSRCAAKACSTSTAKMVWVRLLSAKYQSYFELGGAVRVQRKRRHTVYAFVLRSGY